MNNIVEIVEFKVCLVNKVTKNGTPYKTISIYYDDLEVQPCFADNKWLAILKALKKYDLSNLVLKENEN